jgi:hypothetical protein
MDARIKSGHNESLFSARYFPSGFKIFTNSA